MRRVEAALEERERFLSSIIDSIQDGISIIDSDLNIVRVNRAKERDHAYAMPLVGKKCYEAFHETGEPCAICPVRAPWRPATLTRKSCPQNWPVKQGSGI